jgi:hypothetical protein
LPSKGSRAALLQSDRACGGLENCFHDGMDIGRTPMAPIVPFSTAPHNFQTLR